MGDNGKENGNYYIVIGYILGLYGGCQNYGTHSGNIRVILGFYGG